MKKYKENIKKVARRKYQKRITWLKNNLGDEIFNYFG